MTQEALRFIRQSFAETTRELRRREVARSPENIERLGRESAITRIKERIKILREGRAEQVRQTDLFLSLLGGTEATAGAQRAGLLRNLEKAPTDEEIRAFVQDITFFIEDSFRASNGQIIPPNLNGLSIEEYVLDNLFNEAERDSNFSNIALLSADVGLVNQGITGRERETSVIPTDLTARAKYITTVNALDDFNLLPEHFSNKLRQVDPISDISAFTAISTPGITPEDKVEAAVYSRNLFQDIQKVTDAIVEQERSESGAPISGVYEFELGRLLSDTPPEQLISGDSFLPALPPNAFERQRQQLIGQQEDDRNLRERLEREVQNLGQQTEGLADPDDQKAVTSYLDDIEGRIQVAMAPLEAEGLLESERTQLMDSLISAALPGNLAGLREQIVSGIPEEEEKPFTIRDAQSQARDAFVQIGEDNVDSDILNEAARVLFANRNFPIGVRLDPTQAAAGQIPIIRERERQEQIAQQTKEIAAKGPANLISDSLSRRGTPLPAIGTVSPNRASQAAQRSIISNILNALTPAVGLEIEQAQAETRLPDIDSVINRLLSDPQSIGLNPTDIDVPAGRFGDVPFGPPSLANRLLTPGAVSDVLSDAERGSQAHQALARGDAVIPGENVPAPPFVPEVNRAVRTARQPARFISAEPLPSASEAQDTLRTFAGGDETFLSFLLGSGNALGRLQQQQEKSVEREIDFAFERQGRSRRGPLSRKQRTVGPTLSSLLSGSESSIRRQFRDSPEFEAEREREQQRALRRGRIRILA